METYSREVKWMLIQILQFFIFETLAVDSAWIELWLKDEKHVCD